MNVPSVRNVSALLAVAVLLAGSPAVAEARQGLPPLRAAVLADEKTGGEFDDALKAIGWSAKKFADSPDGRRDLQKRLGDFDLVLVAPGARQAFPTEEPDGIEWSSFMEKGGALVATGVTSPNDVAWLAALDLSCAVRVETPDKGKHAPQARADTDWNASLLCYPEGANVPAEPIARHFVFTGRNGRQWETAGRVHGQPCVVVRRFGKGALALSTARFRDAAFLGNVGKMLELQRMGMAFCGIRHEFREEGDKTDKIALGSGTTRVTFRNTSGASLSARVVMRVSGKEDSRTFWGVGGQKQDGRFDVGVPVRMDLHGKGDVAITVENSGTGKSALLSTFAVDLPDFLETEPPAYRGMISTARRDPNVHVTVRLNPVSENVAGTRIEVSVADPAGKVLATREVVADGPGRIPLTLPLAADAPVGVYALSAKTMRGGALPESATATFKVVPLRPRRMFIDQDGVILNEGKPFFPLGLYHAHSWQLDEFLGLGANMIQCWNWDWDDNVSTTLNVLKVEDAEKRAAKIKENAERQAKLLKAGIRLLYEEGSIWGEMVNYSRPMEKGGTYSFETNAELRAKLEKIRDDPSKLVGMWYIADEVWGRGWVPSLLRARNLFHSLDEDTLTYNLGTGDASVSAGGDVYAVDVYPRYAGGKATLTRVADIMDSSRADTGFRQPVIAVLQAFGQKGQPTESPADVRCMSYLAVTHGVQGVLWYCWKQTGDWDGKQSQGMGWDPPTAEMVKAVIAEFKVFAPALLEPGSRMLKSHDGRIHAILCGSERTGRFLVYVNGENGPAESTLSVPELAGMKLEPLFSGPEAKVSKGKLTLKLPPLATCAFRVR